jgi:hypothetical protein
MPIQEDSFDPSAKASEQTERENNRVSLCDGMVDLAEFDRQVAAQCGERSCADERNQCEQQSVFDKGSSFFASQY